MADDRGVAISVFAGAGGLDLGVEAAGFRVAAACETDHDAADTMEKNFAGLHRPVVRQDILTVPTRELLHAAGLRGRERPDLLVGGPPCTPFSKSGFWLEWKRSGLDPDASLLQAYTRVLAEAQPRAFMLENVYALTYANQASRPAFSRLLREITEAGYDHTWGVLNAADHGVPQARPRLFVIGVRRGAHVPELPRPTHGGRWERRSTGSSERPHVTAGEALADLVTTSEPEETVAAASVTSCPRSLPAATTCTTPPSAGTRTRCSSGAAGSGASSSSSTRAGRRLRSKPSQGRTSGRSTGTTAASASPSSSASSPFQTTSSWSAAGRRSRPSWATRCPRCWPNGWPGRWRPCWREASGADMTCM